MSRSQNNKGFSLVELIVVIAILGVLVGLSATSMNIVGRARAKEAVQTIDKMISRCRAENLSGLDCEVLVSGNRVSLCMGEGEEIDAETLKSSVTVSPASCTFDFNMKTGALTNDSDQSVSVSSGRVSYQIVFDTLTGNHTVQ